MFKLNLKIVCPVYLREKQIGNFDCILHVSFISQIFQTEHIAIATMNKQRYSNIKKRALYGFLYGVYRPT